MKLRLQPWLLVVIVVAVCAGIIWFEHWRRGSRHLDAAGLVQCLPQDRAAHMFIDVKALRQSGILDLIAGSKAQEEPDYRRFVEQTGFDYRTDMDSVAVAFLNGDQYFVLQGRFDWRQLTKYATAQGGHCLNLVCDMPASTPERHISFYPLRPDVLALAVSESERGVTMIGFGQWRNPPPMPPEPVWALVPSYVFANTKDFPVGTHSFLSRLDGAERVLFAAGPNGDALRIRLDVTFANADMAKDVAGQLSRATDQLKKMIALDHREPNQNNFEAVLTSGAFQQSERHVTGTWPLSRAFVDAFAEGKIQ